MQHKLALRQRIQRDVRGCQSEWRHTIVQWFASEFMHPAIDRSKRWYFAFETSTLTIVMYTEHWKYILETSAHSVWMECIERFSSTSINWACTIVETWQQPCTNKSAFRTFRNLRYFKSCSNQHEYNNIDTQIHTNKSSKCQPMRSNSCFWCAWIEHRCTTAAEDWCTISKYASN